MAALPRIDPPDIVEPVRLRVLELSFLESSQRELLERFGIRILDESESTELLESPVNLVRVRFEDTDEAEAFRMAAPSLPGVLAAEPVRGSRGVADPRRFVVRFDSIESGKAFIAADEQAARWSYRLGPKPQVARQKQTTRIRLTVQFPDQKVIDQLLTELNRYRQGNEEPGFLTPTQRAQLFDALEAAARLGPEDRRGSVLAAECPTSGRFLVDVDLWHPGDADLRDEAIRDFEALVKRIGGRVTDFPRSVANTLLLSRVEVDRSGLDALLAYERVAHVDLPPKFELPPITPFTPVEAPDQLPPIPEDGPLACVIDSGVVSGHPMLRGVVIAAESFESGEESESDQAGHGTLVAGIVAYGDVQECVDKQQWQPRVQVLSAKVLRQAPNASAGPTEFAKPERAVFQIEEAIRHFASEYGCRIFNLSVGDLRRPFLGGRQLEWALVLDELARELDVVLVVSAGNVSQPGIPAVAMRDQFQRAVRDQLFFRDHALIDPAPAALALSVGALARTDLPRESWHQFEESREQKIPRLAGSPSGCPSPFTRTGVGDQSGSGLRRAVKPELVDFGGNYALAEFGGQWQLRDPYLGELSLNANFQSGRLIAASPGTSFAAPHVTHACAVVEAELRRTARDGAKPTANLIRALVVHAASHGQVLRDWMTEGCSEAEGLSRLLQTSGYGRTDPDRAAFSADNRAVLIAEEEIEEDNIHLFELELPVAFLDTGGRRRIRVSLAYDPPTRASRIEYLSRTMWFQVYRGHQTQEVLEAMRQAKGTGEPPARLNAASSRPTYTALQWSTVQSATFEGKSRQSFDYAAVPDGPAVVHILVGCVKRFDSAASPLQRYALVTSLEHDNESVQLHQVIRQQVEQRVRIQA
ncbi:MAG: S8 family peptidase [Vicinamibacterales bacterium]